MYLRTGTKYNYIIKVKNDLRDVYSNLSTPRISEFIRLPNDNGIGTTVNFNENTSNTSVSSPSANSNLNNTSVLYLNSSKNRLH